MKHGSRSGKRRDIVAPYEPRSGEVRGKVIINNNPTARHEAGGGGWVEEATDTPHCAVAIAPACTGLLILMPTRGIAT